MLKLKTKTAFLVPEGRGVKSVIVRLIIDALQMDKNNVIPKGYYYYFNEDNQVVQLDKISENPILWEDVALAESQLPAMTSTTSLKADLMERLKQFVLIRLHAEAGTNYGTSDTDFEDDNE